MSKSKAKTLFRHVPKDAGRPGSHALVAGGDAIRGHYRRHTDAKHELDQR